MKLKPGRGKKNAVEAVKAEVLWFNVIFFKRVAEL